MSTAPGKRVSLQIRIRKSIKIKVRIEGTEKMTRNNIWETRFI